MEQYINNGTMGWARRWALYAFALTMLILGQGCGVAAVRGRGTLTGCDVHPCRWEREKGEVAPQLVARPSLRERTDEEVRARGGTPTLDEHNRELPAALRADNAALRRMVEGDNESIRVLRERARAAEAAAERYRVERDQALARAAPAQSAETAPEAPQPPSRAPTVATRERRHRRMTHRARSVPGLTCNPHGDGSRATCVIPHRPARISRAIINLAQRANRAVQAMQIPHNIHVARGVSRGRVATILQHNNTSSSCGIPVMIACRRAAPAASGPHRHHFVRRLGMCETANGNARAVSPSSFVTNADTIAACGDSPRVQFWLPGGATIDLNFGDSPPSFDPIDTTPPTDDDGTASLPPRTRGSPSASSSFFRGTMMPSTPSEVAVNGTPGMVERRHRSRQRQFVADVTPAYQRSHASHGSRLAFASMPSVRRLDRTDRAS